MPQGGLNKSVRFFLTTTRSHLSDDALLLKFLESRQREDHVDILFNIIRVDVEMVDINIFLGRIPQDISAGWISPCGLSHFPFHIKWRIALHAYSGRGHQ